jgi:hypothetical protein
MNTPLIISTALYITLISIILCNKSSKNTKVIVILFNCVILSILFFHIFQYKFVNVEGFEAKSEKLNSLAKKIMVIMNSKDDKKTKDNEILNQIEITKKSLTTKEEKEEFEKYLNKVDDNVLDKIESGLNNAPTENMITLDQLSNENKNTLQQIYTKMSTTDIENMFKLDNDKFTQMLNEITMTKK